MATLAASLLFLPQVGWGQGTGSGRGKNRGDLEISLYAWGPQQVIYPKEAIHHKAGESATHHLDVRVYDLDGRIYVPYLNVKTTISDRTKKREFTVELEPMIGEWLHYGANITLPRRGEYSILIGVQPPDIARYKHLADVWNSNAQAVFTYEYR